MCPPTVCPLYNRRGKETRCGGHPVAPARWRWHVQCARAKMLANVTHRRMLLGLGLVAGMVLALGLAVGLGLGVRFFNAADYPGALPVSDHTLSKATNVFYYQRNTSYRTTDLFPEVYNWYSQTFDLGPEARAQSACITMERSGNWMAIVESMITVTVCDTSQGRLIFVQRFMLLRFTRT
jgi:hypothetical protein